MNATRHSYRGDVEKLIPRLRQYARALVTDHRQDAADDLVHDALSHALRSERHWVGEDVAIKLFTRLTAANRLRARAYLGERRSSPSGLGLSDQQAHGQATHQMSQTDLLPHSAGGSPGRALDLLSLGHREALLLVVLGRFDYPQAAQIIGIPTGTFVTRLVHAREQLGETLWSSTQATAEKAERRQRSTHLRLVKS
ncbi:RNA polymerase subunit sigma-70 [Lichenihabitans psoromatis]|uniref:RNA polymerase subunit sigma-70 n=2 Tax=Lichenihabitans psoromatis TaxID=2528642 RepID=UPI0010383DDE|nr:RNA polymerase subunit sigma-70 [Lichenihabitans psoromatis]